MSVKCFSVTFIVNYLPRPKSCSHYGVLLFLCFGLGYVFETNILGQLHFVLFKAFLSLSGKIIYGNEND